MYSLSFRYVDLPQHSMLVCNSNYCEWSSSWCPSHVTPVSHSLSYSPRRFSLLRLQSFGSGGFATIAHHVLLIRLASDQVSPGQGRQKTRVGGRSEDRRKTEKHTKKQGDGVIYKPTGTTQSEATPDDEGCPHFESPLMLSLSFLRHHVRRFFLFFFSPFASTRASLHRDAWCMLHRRMRDVCAKYTMRTYESVNESAALGFRTSRMLHSEHLVRAHGYILWTSIE